MGPCGPIGPIGPCGPVGPAEPAAPAKLTDQELYVPEPLEPVVIKEIKPFAEL